MPATTSHTNSRLGADFNGVIAELSEAGYVVVVERKRDGPGRPPSPWIVINPEAEPDA